MSSSSGAPGAKQVKKLLNTCSIYNSTSNSIDISNSIENSNSIDNNINTEINNSIESNNSIDINNSIDNSLHGNRWTSIIVDSDSQCSQGSRN